jgi:hypothetical protein
MKKRGLNDLSVLQSDLLADAPMRPFIITPDVADTCIMLFHWNCVHVTILFGPGFALEGSDREVVWQYRECVKVPKGWLW